MKTWLSNRWESLRANFWFVPSLMAGAAVLLSFLTLWLDHLAGVDWIESIAWTYSRGPEGARALLSTVAGSMITIASLTFSITIVTLQLASSQFGPRLLRNFVRDRGNQVVLGTFIATFLYCLLILRTVNGTEQREFVPHISVSTGMVLAVASLGVLIYFIHHIAHSIQAETVIDAVGRDLLAAIDRLFPESIGHEAGGSGRREPEEMPPGDFERDAGVVPAPSSNYLQAVDGAHLLGLASDRDLLLRVEARPGQFVVGGHDLVRVAPASAIDDGLREEILDAFYFGSRRTQTQDIEFAVDQLVEVAVRALSPGINDPFTAITCVDRLGAALCALGDREAASPYRRDDEGRLRVIAASTTLPGIVDAAFHQIRQAARSNTAVTLRLLETIEVILAFARDPSYRQALVHHASLVHDASQEGLPGLWDRQEAEARYQSVLEAAAREPQLDPARA